MADNETITSDQTTDTGGKTETTPAEWKTIAGEKFKTEAELAKAYKELETKFGQQGEDIRKSREFEEQVLPVLEAIRNDPEVFKKLDETLRKVPSENQTANTNQASKTVSPDDVRSVTTDILVNQFEQKHGIDKLSPEERKTLRNNIGNIVLDLTGQALDKVDLRRVGSVLENAYVLANKDKIIEKSKQEALAEAQGIEAGSIGSLSSSGEKSETALTPEEAKVATRLGLTREQYLAGKQSPSNKKS